MLTIKAWNGRDCILSDEVYEILNNDHPSRDYKKGCLVRKISGVGDSSTPGYHWRPEFVTVCRVGAEYAEFCGIEIDQLKLLESRNAQVD
jgi:hypothetical protein